MVHGYDTAIRWKKYPKLSGGSRDPYLAFMGIQDDNENSTNTNSITNNNNTNYQGAEHNPVVYTIDKIVIVDGKRYKYRETEDGMNIILRRSNEEVCFHIRLQNDIEPTGKKMAILQSFHQYTSCSMDDGTTGKHLLLAVVEILRSCGDIIYMTIQDESHKDLPNGKSIPLADMYFVCTGKTWYGSILSLQPQNKKYYNRAYSKIKKNTWEKIFKYFKDDYPDFSIPVDISDINIKKHGSAMQVFQRIKEAKTDFFADYADDIAVSSGIKSMQGSGWTYTF